MNYNTIGKKIKKLRKDRGLTQEQLGIEIGVSMQAVSKWECGGSPDIDMLVKLADYFDVTADSLLGRCSDAEGVLEEALYADIQRTHVDNRLEKACNYSWVMLKALSAMPAVKDDSYCNVPADEMVCSQARILLDTGLVNMSATKDFHYFLVMPEPRDGYGVALSDVDDYIEFFKHLSRPNRLKMLCYLYSVKTSLISAKRAASDIGIPIHDADQILKEFSQRSWVYRESATLEDSEISLYRPNQSTQFVPLLRFATEMIEMPSLWFISNMKRSAPMLRSDINKRNKKAL